MSQHIRKLFEITHPGGLGQDLVNRVIENLEQDQKRLARRKLFVLGITDIFLMMGLAASSFYFFELIARSGSHHYLSLLWSDGGMIAFYWHELLLSLVESLPILGLIILLGGMLAFLFSLSKTIANFKLAY